MRPAANAVVCAKPAGAVDVGVSARALDAAADDANAATAIARHTMRRCSIAREPPATPLSASAYPAKTVARSTKQIGLPNGSTA